MRTCVAALRLPGRMSVEQVAGCWWAGWPDGVECAPHPAVVMAHGIGAIKAGGLAPFAERFSEEGFVAIAFDYRNFGGSGGQPREVLSVPRQLADYSSVIGWAVEQAYIDPRQVIVWGTSFAGMHVLELAVSDTRLKFQPGVFCAALNEKEIKRPSLISLSGKTGADLFAHYLNQPNGCPLRRTADWMGTRLQAGHPPPHAPPPPNATCPRTTLAQRGWYAG